MPTYEYACTVCGERTEKKQSFDDPPLEECPKCGGKLRKLYSPVGIVFKGSGFYATDGRRSARPKSTAKKEDASTSSSGKSSSGSSSGSSSSSPPTASPRPLSPSERWATPPWPSCPGTVSGISPRPTASTTGPTCGR